MWRDISRRVLSIEGSPYEVSMRGRSTKMFLVLTVFLACPPVFAHHGNSSYDSKNPIALKARVTEFDWQNPHAQLYFDVQDDKGNVVHWTAETLSPSSLARAGWRRNSVKPGDEVTVVLMPAKNGAPIGHFHEIIFSDGRKLGVGEECLYCTANPSYKSEPKQ